MYLSVDEAARTINPSTAQASGAMDTDGPEAPAPTPVTASAVGLLPEVELYAYLLIVLYLVDHQLYAEARPPAAPAETSMSMHVDNRTLKRLHQQCNAPLPFTV